MRVVCSVCSFVIKFVCFVCSFVIISVCLYNRLSRMLRMSYLKKGSLVTYVLKIIVSLFFYVFDFVVVEEDDFVVFAFLLHLE